MKYLILIFLLASCAKDNQPAAQAASPGACSNDNVIGTWKYGSDYTTFSADCTGTGTSCASTFTYPANVNNGNGSVLFTITTTNGAAGCLPAGANVCSYSLSNNNLDLTCSGVTLNYVRQ